MTSLKKNTYLFSKMHGLGNDFVVINALHHPFLADKADIARMACRRTGVGFDQLLLLTPPPDGVVAQFGYRIFNADGTEAGQCGNGARCLAQFIARAGLHTTPTITVALHAGGVMHLRLGDPIADTWGFKAETAPVQVDMGTPRWSPMLPALQSAVCDLLDNMLPNSDVGTAVLLPLHIDMGNAHIVIGVSHLDVCPVAVWGPAIQSMVSRMQGIKVNVGFVQLLSCVQSGGAGLSTSKRQVLRLRVYENGAGETWACGSGACAAAVGVQLSQGLGVTLPVAQERATLPCISGFSLSTLEMDDDKARIMQGQRTVVYLRRGPLVIQWSGPAETVALPVTSDTGEPSLWMTGPTAHVFDGQITLPLKQ